jgi:type IV pilus biogenesis protein CpaD/CtpE
LNPILTSARRAGPILAGALAAATLSGCATDSPSMARAPAGPPVCPADATAPPPFGCANVANLRAMVANPADLTQGREMTPGSAAREAVPVEAYNKGETKKLPSSSSSVTLSSTPN